MDVETLKYLNQYVQRKYNNILEKQTLKISMLKISKIKRF